MENRNWKIAPTAKSMSAIRNVATTMFLYKIDHFSSADCHSIITLKAKKPTLKQVQAVRCPACGAGPGKKCELSTGQPRTEPHRDRRLIAAD